MRKKDLNAKIAIGAFVTIEKRIDRLLQDTEKFSDEDRARANRQNLNQYRLTFASCHFLADAGVTSIDQISDTETDSFILLYSY